MAGKFERSGLRLAAGQGGTLAGAVGRARGSSMAASAPSTRLVCVAELRDRTSGSQSMDMFVIERSASAARESDKRA